MSGVRLGRELHLALQTAAGLASAENASRFFHAYGDGFFASPEQPEEIGWIEVKPFETIETLKARWENRPVPYVGDVLPKYVVEGLVMRVKGTPYLRKNGIAVAHGLSSVEDNRAFSGDVGIVDKYRGNGWWDWRIEFSRGRWTTLRKEHLGDFMREKLGVAMTLEGALAQSHDVSGMKYLTTFSYEGLTWDLEDVDRANVCDRKCYVAIVRDDLDKPEGMFAGVYVPIDTSEILVMLQRNGEGNHLFTYPRKSMLPALRSVLTMVRRAAQARQVNLVEAA